MFDRPKYKRFAKAQLKGRYSVPIFMTLVMAGVSLLYYIPLAIRFVNSGIISMAMSGDVAATESAANQLMLTSMQTSSTVMSTVYSIILQIMAVAALNVYLKMTRTPEKVSFSNFIEGFNNWGRAVLGAIWQMLWVFLWSMLFFIPGIIKQISYSQMFFLIAEYDGISVNKAMRISMEITRGHKWELFVMELSFIGWYFLNSLTFGILSLFIMPYRTLSFANAYHDMLKEAVESGRITAEDLAQ